MRYVKVSEISFQSTGYEEYHEVIVKGIGPKREEISEEIDLTYTHIQGESWAVYVGFVIDLDCNPCVGYIPWNCPEYKQ